MRTLKTITMRFRSLPNYEIIWSQSRLTSTNQLLMSYAGKVDSHNLSDSESFLYPFSLIVIHSIALLSGTNVLFYAGYWPYLYCASDFKIPFKSFHNPGNYQISFVMYLRCHAPFFTESDEGSARICHTNLWNLWPTYVLQNWFNTTSLLNPVPSICYVWWFNTGLMLLLCSSK